MKLGDFSRAGLKSPGGLCVSPSFVSLFATARLTAQIDTGEKKELRYELVFLRGHNQKQNNVTLEPIN